MDATKEALETRAAIVKNYKLATYCYATPFVCLLLGFIHFMFFPLFLITLFPLGVAGMFFTRRGLSLAVKSGDREKKDVGYANVTLGIIVLVAGAGLIGLVLIYIRT